MASSRESTERALARPLMPVAMGIRCGGSPWLRLHRPRAVPEDGGANRATYERRYKDPDLGCHGEIRVRERQFGDEERNGESDARHGGTACKVPPTDAGRCLAQSRLDRE